MNIENIVQVGRVSDVNKAKRMVRVIWPASGKTSGWLYVLQHFDADLNIVPDAEHTHVISDTHGGGSASTEPNHNHPGSTVTFWLPKVNESVLVIYLPVEDGDGFVIGRVT
ncbi:MAG: hypothetical protein OSJ64_00855 [Firmicutes bacterium]|nr:hypothetical protein [Bacillota bacterium]